MPNITDFRLLRQLSVDPAVAALRIQAPLA
jgi:hypothetical protein